MLLSRNRCGSVEALHFILFYRPTFPLQIDYITELGANSSIGRLNKACFVLGYSFPFSVTVKVELLFCAGHFNDAKKVYMPTFEESTMPKSLWKIGKKHLALIGFLFLLSNNIVKNKCVSVVTLAYHGLYYV